MTRAHVFKCELIANERRILEGRCGDCRVRSVIKQKLRARRANSKPVLDGLVIMKENKLRIEVTNPIIPTFNEAP